MGLLEKKPDDLAALSLVTVGALNWGLVGVAGFNLVARLLGDRSAASRVVYSAVGAAGLYLVAKAVIENSSAKPSQEEKRHLKSVA